MYLLKRKMNKHSRKLEPYRGKYTSNAFKKAPFFMLVTGTVSKKSALTFFI